jgi:hypothetical protein
LAGSLFGNFRQYIGRHDKRHPPVNVSEKEDR